MYGLQLSKLFTYPNTFIISWDQRGSDNWRSTVYTIKVVTIHRWTLQTILWASCIAYGLLVSVDVLVLIYWATNTGSSNVFSVIPEERELIAGACCSFTVIFSPVSDHLDNNIIILLVLQCNPNQYYSGVLDCYICYKSMRELQDNDNIITAPWCISISARGNSFVSSSEPYLPRALFTPRNIVMPSSSVGQTAHQTFIMTNNGNSPIAYDFQQHRWVACVWCACI